MVSTVQETIAALLVFEAFVPLFPGFWPLVFERLIPVLLFYDLEPLEPSVPFQVPEDVFLPV